MIRVYTKAVLSMESFKIGGSAVRPMLAGGGPDDGISEPTQMITFPHLTRAPMAEIPADGEVPPN